MDLLSFQMKHRRYLLLALSICTVYFLLTFLKYGNSSPEQSATLISTPLSNTTSPPASTTPSTPIYDPQKLAFMVETRTLPHLPAQFLHMSSIIPPEWNLLFMGSPASITYMRSSRAILTLENAGRLRFTEIPPQYSVKDRESISRMFTDRDLYATVLAPAEHLLVFQPDAIFCVNSEQSLNDYLDWDWIGAPWGPNIEYGGNGGLSLRKVSRILQVLDKSRRPHGDGALEDLGLVDRLHELEGARLPNATVSKHFSVESVWDERPLGYHIGYLGVHHEQIWDVKEQVEHVFEYCPEVALIMKMEMKGDKPKGIS